MLQSKLGSRESQLALVQARLIKNLLREIKIDTEIISYKSEGDVNLIQPIYEIGIQGIFTRTLDEALLNHKIDLAVHSLKDLPTQLPKGLVICAIPQRANPFDVFISKETFSYNQPHQTIATSSLRRKAQWLNRYPHHTIDNIRGNVHTRLQKFKNNVTWTGIIFAKAGLDRLNISDTRAVVLDWMIPAPAQGAIAVVCRAEDSHLIEIGESITHKNTWNCVHAERQFLSVLHGGCSVPIGCYAYIENEKMHIEGCILTKDGKEKLSKSLTCSSQEYSIAGKLLAEELQAMGAQKIIETYRKEI